jgi:hypothetical protein
MELPEDPLLRGVVFAVERVAVRRSRPLDPSHRADLLLAELAARQDGLVTFAQVRELGVSAQAVLDRRRHGRLHQLHRGVYAVGTARLTDDGRRRAALLATGPTALLSHRSLGYLLGCRDAEHDRVEVTVAGRHGRTRSTVLVHRPATLTDEDRTTTGTFPTTTVARMVVDLMAVLPVAELAHVLRQLDRTGRLDLVAIERAVRRVARPRGVQVLRTLLADYEDVPGVPFVVLERRFRRLCRAFDLPVGTPQARVEGSPRRPDVLYEGLGIAVELDDRSTHERLAAVVDDRRRDLELAALGIQTIRLTDEDLTRRAAQTAELLRRAFAARAAA